MAELERVQSRYRERDASATLTGFWTLRNPVVLHIAQERERVALQALTDAGLELSGARVLDIGCGMGQEFANLSRWGAPADGLYGIDLIHERLAAARPRSAAALVQASAAALPFPDASFDVVGQNVVFSSIVDEATRVATAAEMLRVLRPGGWVLWYDAVRMRGHDPHFRPVPVAELEALFPSMHFEMRRLTTDLGLLRRVQMLFGVRGMNLFDMLGLFKTHVFALGRKP